MFMIIYYNFLEQDLIQRLFYYKDASVVGARFYSLFGEPRDATVALVTIISMIIILFKNFDKKIMLITQFQQYHCHIKILISCYEVV